MLRHYSTSVQRFWVLNMTSMSLKTYTYSSAANSNYYSVYKISSSSLYMTFIGSNSSLITLTYLIAATLSPTSSVNFVADSPSLSLSQGILKFTASHYASGASPYVISNTPDILTSGTQVNITSNYPILPGTVYPNSSALSFVYLL